ncbi:hypothetical protein [Ralstonia mojiangensis]|uniref:hypothetical protein n=1 Tax=Ralstonia mojiangensis TaxID=2953895 RepID=UPI0021B3F33C|nr:hypothetical protein [Ralstonia mojiangensis]MCT7329681.1 hypothetical protein [Ralstonia mojiangensis]
MSRLVFEKVSDINFTYPYICIYQQGEINPFMEIGIDELKEIKFTIYPINNSISLDITQWEEISKQAQTFLQRALEDDEAS